jgi:hypothetical protein
MYFTDQALSVLVYANNLSVLGVSIHTTRKSTESLVVTSEEIVLEVNVQNGHILRSQRRTK